MDDANKCMFRANNKDTVQHADLHLYCLVMVRVHGRTSQLIRCTNYKIVSLDSDRLLPFSRPTSLRNRCSSDYYVNVSVIIKFSQKTSVFTLIIISSP